jgi:hypothetical protein
MTKIAAVVFKTLQAILLMDRWVAFRSFASWKRFGPASAQPGGGSTHPTSLLISFQYGFSGGGKVTCGSTDLWRAKVNFLKGGEFNMLSVTLFLIVLLRS